MIVACDPVAETEEVYVFVTVFLTKLSVAVCDEVVECVEVIVDVLEMTEDLEIVGEADRVLETEVDPETVNDILGVNVITELRVPEILVVDVLDIELDLVFVEELV